MSFCGLSQTCRGQPGTFSAAWRGKICFPSLFFSSGGRGQTCHRLRKALKVHQRGGEAGSLDGHVNAALLPAGTDTTSPGCRQTSLLELCNEVFHIPSPAGTSTASKGSKLGVCCGVWPCWQPWHPEPLSHEPCPHTGSHLPKPLHTSHPTPEPQTIGTDPKGLSHPMASLPRVQERSSCPPSAGSALSDFPRWDTGNRLWIKGSTGAFPMAELLH